MNTRLGWPRTLRTALLPLAIGVGCGGGGTGIPANGITQTVGSAGAAITITAAGDPDIAGTTLIIPANALAADTVITVSKGSDEAAAGEASLGPSVRFTPDGLVFKVPATLTLPWKPAMQPQGSALAVAVMSAGMRSELVGAAITVDAKGGSVTTDIAHFTDYQVVAAPGKSGCKADADCAGGQVCVANQCQAKSTDGGTGCHVDADCAPNSACVAGACMPKSGDGGLSDGGHSDGGVPDASPFDGATDAGVADAGAHD
jgi:hypothetical protein